MYDEIYRQRWEKDSAFYGVLGGDGSSVTYLKYQDAKSRKDILRSFFSRSSISAREWMIQENVRDNVLL